MDYASAITRYSLNSRLSLLELTNCLAPLPYTYISGETIDSDKQHYV